MTCQTHGTTGRLELMNVITNQAWQDSWTSNQLLQFWKNSPAPRPRPHLLSCPVSPLPPPPSSKAKKRMNTTAEWQPPKKTVCMAAGEKEEVAEGEEGEGEVAEGEAAGEEAGEHPCSSHSVHQPHFQRTTIRLFYYRCHYRLSVARGSKAVAEGYTWEVWIGEGKQMLSVGHWREYAAGSSPNFCGTPNSPRPRHWPHLARYSIQRHCKEVTHQDHWIWIHSRCRSDSHTEQC